MPKLNMKVSHGLGQDEATKRIKKLLSQMKTELTDKVTNLQESWEGNIGTFSFSAMGFGISGSLIIKPTEVELDGKLPFAAMFFKGLIESTIREGAENLLA